MTATTVSRVKLARQRANPAGGPLIVTRTMGRAADYLAGWRTEFRNGAAETPRPAPGGKEATDYAD
jgi:hypothetical protein